MKRNRKKWPWLLALVALSLPALAWCVEPPPRQVRRDGLAAHHLAGWVEGQGGTEALRGHNPEWDLMTRMFTVIALADRALAGRDRNAALSAMDAIITGTLASLREHGSEHFLLGYARAKPFRYQAGRSLFVDGEIAMMLAARQLVSPHAEQRHELRHFSTRVAEQIAAGPILCGESYPDECWTFCNTTALAALRMGDAATGSDHDALIARWLASAKQHLIDPATGLLVSSYSWDGEVFDGPEGSTAWMSAHNLRLLDEDFARDQYRRAHEALAIDVLGFGFAREWPDSSVALPDIDSGWIVPVLGASASSSGLGLLAAASFGDDAYFDALSRSLELAALPIESGGRLRYAAAGAMGDAVIFAAHEVGPLWRAVQQARHQLR